MKWKYVASLCLSVLVIGSLFVGCSTEQSEQLSDVDRVKKIVVDMDNFFDKLNSFTVKMSDLSETVGVVTNKPVKSKLNDYIYFPSKDDFIGSIGMIGVEPLTPKVLENLSIEEISKTYKKDFDEAALNSFGAITLNYKEMSKVYNAEKSYTIFTRHFYTADNVNLNMIDLKGKRDFVVYKKYILHKVDEGFELFDFNIVYDMDGVHEEVAKLLEEENASDIKDKIKNDIVNEFETYDGEEVVFERY